MGLVSLIKKWRNSLRRKRALRLLPTLLACAAFLAASLPSLAQAETRTLYLYYTHTKETARITFKRNGRYDQKGLAELNYFLRDWRRNEPTKMDPKLFDLVWEVYQEVRATGPIYIVSAYRAPQTNEMLRSRSRAVAKNSRHTMGMAMDFYIPGVPLKKLRETAMKLQVGGVGYYPTSGSPFVHLDTGNVRAWPRMTRTQLASLFPKGRTLHVPADGKLLSQAGYSYAKTQWLKCHEVPCTGGVFPDVRVASADQSAPTPASGSGRTLMDMIFGNAGSNGEEKGKRTSAPAATPQPVTIAAAPIPAPLPGGLRATASANGPLAPNSPVSPNAPVPAPPLTPTIASGAPVQLASADIAPVPAPARPGLRAPGLVAGPAQTQTTGSVPMRPAPRVLMSPAPSQPQAPVLTAYAPAISPEPNAQKALQMLIERNNTVQGTAPASLPAFNTRDLRPATASISPELNGFSSLFNGLTGRKQTQTTPKAAPVELHAPDFDHIVEIFLDTAAMESARYAILFDTPDADLTQHSDLGRFAGALKFSTGPVAPLGVGKFAHGKSLFVSAPRS